MICSIIPAEGDGWERGNPGKKTFPRLFIEKDLPIFDERLFRSLIIHLKKIAHLPTLPFNPLTRKGKNELEFLAIS